MSTHQVLRGATVVDGTGARRQRADVEIEAGRIVEVGTIGRRPDADDIDLEGLVLSPGFIDVHTHFDAQVFWDPDFTPSSWHGITTAIQGNCGFGIAPMRPGDREAIMETLNRVEDMSIDTLRAGIDWSFETFPEYFAALDRAPKKINLASYVGHSALRMFTMGADAASERAATDDEVARMQSLIREAMAAGAVGFSTSQAPSHLGVRALPVPSRLAEPDELARLMAAVAESARGIVEITYGPIFEIEDVARLAKDLGLRVTWGSLLTDFFGGHGAAVEMLERASAIGADLWPQVSCRFITTLLDLNAQLRFFPAQGAWRDAMNAKGEARMALFRDPAWRDRARDLIDGKGKNPAFRAERWQRMWVDETIKHSDLRGRYVHELATERGVHPLDVVLDLALEEQLETRFRVATANVDAAELQQLLTDRRTLLGAHDAGAHVATLCDASYPSWLLGHWVRDQQALSLEEAVYKMTGQPAEIFRFADRGRIAPGMAADLVAFDPDTVAALPNERVWDFPANGDRLVSRNEGTYFVWVNGEPIKRDGTDVAGAAPGRMVTATG